MADFIKQKKILEELNKARNAVKRKYNLIKFQKDNTDRVLKETFKPLIDPLEKIAENKKARKTKVLKEIIDPLKTPRKISTSFSEEKDEVTNEPENHQTIDNTIDESVPEDELFEDMNIIQNDLELSNFDIDGIYGVRKSDDGYKLGKAPIIFERDKIIVDKTAFPKTPGLVELIVDRNPQNYEVKDLNQYKEILEISCVHRKGFGPGAQIKKPTLSNKFNNIIAPLFGLETPKKSKTPSKAFKKAQINRKSMSTPTKIGKGGLLPRFKIAKRDSRMDYIYWDDPNELVERLQLLIAEQAAGNLSHTNEIHSILQELRESGYIY